jgi:UPF0271 protein
VSKKFEIACDLGEGFGNWTMSDDAELMKHITLANIACGGHAGDPMIMEKTVDLAIENGVAIGAHPGFPDKLGFGRKIIPFDPDDMAAIITYQVGALLGFLRVRDVPLNHLLTHGALFAYIGQNDAVAVAAAKAVHALVPEAKIVWTAPTAGVTYVEELRSLGHDIIPVTVADMHYSPDGKVLIERKKLVTDLDYARAQVQSVTRNGELLLDDGSTLPIPEVEGLLFHSDGPNAVDVVKVIEEEVAAAAQASLAA